MKELNRTQILLVILILLIVGYIIFPKQPVVQGVSVKQMVDSIKAHDVERDKYITSLRIKYTQDSFQIIDIKRKIDSINNKRNSITRKYDNKRNHIDTASDDEQAKFFSEWTSQESE